MKWKKWLHAGKKEHPDGAVGKGAQPKTPACDEAYQLAIEANWTFAMLPVGGFPECLWYFR